MSQREEELICVGHVLGAHGIKGWVRVFSNTSPRQNITSYGPLLLEGDEGLQQKKVKGQTTGKHVLAKIEGIEDRDSAEALTGRKLYISKHQLPQLQADEYYWSELIGMSVENTSSEPLGTVESLLETGADDVLVVQGDRERLIPFVLGQIVTQVDRENRSIVVDWQADYE